MYLTKIGLSGDGLVLGMPVGSGPPNGPPGEDLKVDHQRDHQVSPIGPPGKDLIRFAGNSPDYGVVAQWITRCGPPGMGHQDVDRQEWATGHGPPTVDRQEWTTSENYLARSISNSRIIRLTLKY